MRMTLRKRVVVEGFRPLSTGIYADFFSVRTVFFRDFSDFRIGAEDIEVCNERLEQAESACAQPSLLPCNGITRQIQVNSARFPMPNF